MDVDVVGPQGAFEDRVDDNDASTGEQDPSPKAFFWWMQSLSKKIRAGERERLAELQQALSEKHRLCLLTSDQCLLRGSLALLQLAEAWKERDEVSIMGDWAGLANVINIHRQHTLDSGSSALDSLAFLAYASLLVHLHYAYLDIRPQDDDETSAAPNAKQASLGHLDLVTLWTGIEDAPPMSASGQYLDLTFLRIPKRAQAVAAGVQEHWDLLLSLQSVRECLRDLNSKVSGDVQSSQRVWTLYQQLEQIYLTHDATTDNIELMKALYLARLRTPHQQYETTAQSFSSFVTKFLPSEEYESTMSKAYEVLGDARSLLDACRPYEDSIGEARLNPTMSGVTQKWTVWKPYVTWAVANFSASRKRANEARLDADSACSIFERCLLNCGLPPACIEETLSTGQGPLTKAELASLRGKESRDERKARIERDEEAMRLQREASADAWIHYLDFLSASKASAAAVMDICGRASKALPSNGLVQGYVLRAYIRIRRSESQIDSFFSSAIRNADLRKEVHSFVDLLVARIDVEREQSANRLVLDEQAGNIQEAHALLVKREDTFMNVFGMISFALDTLVKDGLKDDALRLERLMTDWCIAGGAATSPLAEGCWDTALEQQPQNSKVYLYASKYHFQLGDLHRCRSILKQGLGRRDLGSDKKIELVEELLQLSHLAGTLQDVEWAAARLRREKENSWNEYYQTYASQQQPVQQTTADLSAVASADVKMQEDGDIDERANGKRARDEAEPEATTETSLQPVESTNDKRGRQGDLKQRRDREHSSIIVDNLPSDASDTDLLKLFKDCGDILEIVGPRCIATPHSDDVPRATALIEFTSRDSIPAAQSRHLKPIRSYQINIMMGYECTLYVTNFPPAYDSDEAIRSLFARYGRIFEVRWPSKKFSSSRRFCYVVFCSSGDAKEALQLHNTQLREDDTGSSSKLQVLLSDPNRKGVRSDAFNDDKELFISGLSRAVTEDDLKEAFAPSVEHVRIPKHPDGRIRGIAYVDMATVLDAQRVLHKAAEQDGGGYHIKGKLIHVDLVDRKKTKSSEATRNASGSLHRRLDVERRLCCLFIVGLPANAQEPIIQQIVEKQCGIGSVKRIEWTPEDASRGRATIEFKDAATAGRVALSSAAMQYDESHPLRFETLESRGAAAHSASRGLADTDMDEDVPLPPSQGEQQQQASFLVPRSAASARRRGRGRGGGLHFAQRSDDRPSQVGSGIPSDAPSGAQPAAPKGQDAFRLLLQQKKST